jgi:hypothetical protein
MEKRFAQNSWLRMEPCVTNAGFTRLHPEPGEYVSGFFYKHDAPLGQNGRIEGFSLWKSFVFIA